MLVRPWSTARTVAVSSSGVSSWRYRMALTPARARRSSRSSSGSLTAAMSFGRAAGIGGERVEELPEVGRSPSNTRTAGPGEHPAGRQDGALPGDRHLVGRQARHHAAAQQRDAARRSRRRR
jgi:hypothetical protein